MKRLSILLIGAAFVISQACGQAGKDVPEKVKTNFTGKFPEAQKVKWEKENATEWEAEFKLNGTPYSANFNADGTWMETEYEIKESEIPPAVKQTLDRDYTGYEIEESEVTETPEGTFYEFALEKDESELKVSISADGTVVKKETREEGEEGDEDEE